MEIFMEGLSVGYAMCGSFCTLRYAVDQIKLLRDAGAVVTPIMSPIVYTTDTRFGKCADFISEVEELCGKKIIHTVKDAEPIGPRNLLDVIVAAPCTGNTLGKLANGITDTSVTMALKAHLRNEKPVVLAIATNDALGASAKNIGLLFNSQHIFFVPLSQDDPKNKANSLIADFSRIPEAVTAAVNGIQLQPLFY